MPTVNDELTPLARLILDSSSPEKRTHYQEHCIWKAVEMAHNQERILLAMSKCFDLIAQNYETKFLNPNPTELQAEVRKLGLKEN
jgi:hypothetical protein